MCCCPRGIGLFGGPMDSGPEGTRELTLSCEKPESKQSRTVEF
jgi:hypothetical protein